MCGMMDKPLSEHWWGGIRFSLNECKAWQIGERMIVVQRHECEWRIWNIESKDENTHPLELVTPSNTDFLSMPPTQRFLVKRTESSITVMPKLADRAMVIRPSSVISILPGQSSHLYVSTQLWMAFSLAQDSAPMFDVPLWMPSDSWFGESNMVGEICYAKYSEANVDLSSLKKRSHRVFTCIKIINDHEEALHIQRIKMPMPLLDLYVDNEGQFWSDSICLTHNADHNKPSFEINRLHKSKDTSAHKRLSPARKLVDSNVFLRSIKSLIA
jgi:hypothetical protein